MKPLKSNLYAELSTLHLVKAALETYEEYTNSDSKPTTSMEEVAGIALELAQLNSEIMHVLEGLKEILRDEAAVELASDPAAIEDPARDPEWKGYPRGPRTTREPDGKAGVVAFQAESDAGETIGTVTVTFPKRKDIKLKKDTDPSKLKQALGSRFPNYFQEITVYKPVDDFEEKTLEVLLPSGPPKPGESLPSASQAAEARIALTAVEVQAKPTPRVGFKYTGPQSPENTSDPDSGSGDGSDPVKNLK